MTPAQQAGHDLALKAPPLTDEQVEGLARILATVEPNDGEPEKGAGKGAPA